MQPIYPSPSEINSDSMDDSDSNQGELSVRSGDVYFIRSMERDSDEEEGERNIYQYEEYPEEEIEDDVDEEEEEEDEEVDSEDQLWWSGDSSQASTVELPRINRTSSLTQFMGAIPRYRSSPPYLIEKSARTKIHIDDITEQVLDNPPLPYKSWACNQLSYLAPGQAFYGVQNQLPEHMDDDQEYWEVKATIHSIDHTTGTIVGLMEALNAPVASSTVITYWEGEVIDFVNYHFWTGKWEAGRSHDIEHWKRFDAINDLRNSYEAGSASLSKAYDRYIFMRWKEKYFVNMHPSESGLTIAGFYYISIRRSDGFIEGFYYDPKSKPYQKLELRPVLHGLGHAFDEYTFA